MGTFSPTALASFARAIPPARFATYLAAADNHLADAVDLYLWNTEAVGAVMQVTGMVEVLFRDTVDTQLRTWNQRHAGTPEWIVHPAEPLRFIVRKTPPEKWTKRNHNRPEAIYHQWWEARSSHREHNPTHDDLVAGLTFGTWTSIIPAPNARSTRSAHLSVWKSTLCSGFNVPSHHAVYRWAHELRLMRNRASHLRPLIDTGVLLRTHRYSVRLLRAMNEDFGQIVAGLATIPDLVKNKPI